MTKKAFTLIELLVVVAIVAILVALIIPAITKTVKGDNKEKSNPAQYEPVKYQNSTN